jgi:hypothetical protein
MEIPFEGIIAFFLFIIGVPAFVLQFISPEERRVVLKPRFWKEMGFFLFLAFLIVIIAVIVRAMQEDNSLENWIWGFMYLGLFLVTLWVAYRIPNHYGRREQIVTDLENQVSRSLQDKGRLEERPLADLIGLGKQCDSGQEQELVLKALDELVEQACNCSKYRAGMLETVIDETVNMLISQPHPEEFHSFLIAINLLTRIVTSDQMPGGLENLVDHQRAVRALSALGQTMLSQVGYSIGEDFILMGHVETLNLAYLKHPELLTDVSQALFETGSVALDSKNYLFAVAAMERLLTIVEDNQPVPDEASVDMLGLLAHFWTASTSSRAFAEMRLERVKAGIEPLEEALEKATKHCQMTMEFETADKIMVMEKDLQEM